MTPLSGRVLVIGADTLSFLAVVRSLGRAGLEVHVAGCPANAPALRSRYIKAAHYVRRHDVVGLLQLLQEQAFDLVVPCDDFSIVPIQKNRDRFEAAAKVALLNPAAFTICADKASTYDLAQRLGIPLPAQRLVTRVEELHDAANEFGWPLVLKPPASVTGARPGIRNSVLKVRSIEEIGALEGPVLVQQNFVGVGVGVEVLCADGDVLLAFQHERVHEPVLGGGSSYRRSVPLSPHLLAAASDLMRAMNYTGVGMVEFKVNPRTGKWILIEINGRFWGSLPLSIAAGADFPRHLYELWTTGRRTFPQAYKCGVYSRNWLTDVRWFARNLLADRNDPTLMTRSLGSVAAEVFNLPHEHSDTLVVDDPAPALAEVSRAVTRTLQPALWHKRARARRAMANARRVLFVCAGNVCRSPFAERYFRLRAGGRVNVESAGHYGPPGRPAPQCAVDAARQFGVDLASHRSSTLADSQVEAADVIFVFDQRNEDELRGWFPAAAHKVHYLGALSGPLHIRDPWGSESRVFVANYRRIQRAIDKADALCTGSAPDRPPAALRQDTLKERS